MAGTFESLKSALFFSLFILPPAAAAVFAAKRRWVFLAGEALVFLPVFLFYLRARRDIAAGLCTLAYMPPMIGLVLADIICAPMIALALLLKGSRGLRVKSHKVDSP